jgi:hypothetical protein
MQWKDINRPGLVTRNNCVELKESYYKQMVANLEAAAGDGRQASLFAEA